MIPSVNAKLKLAKDWDFRASYARGFRAPALRELYFDFHDANHDINGNENLKAEYSNSFTGSLNWEKPLSTDITLKSSVSGFYSIYRDQITTALANDPSSPNLSVYVNIDKFKTTGGSWENSIAWKNLYANFSIFYIGRYNRYSEVADYSQKDLPTFMWSPELSANLTYLLKPTQTSFALFYKYTGKTPVYQQIIVNGQQQLQLAETASFHFADFTISQRAGRYLSVNAGARNLFDVTRLQSSSVADGVHTSGGPILKATGRSYFLGLAFQL
jgi:outer membrane receptor for ferrienterochelin and colicins